MATGSQIAMRERKRLYVLKTREWYLLRSLLGYWWAMLFILLGGREAGKSYSITEYFVKEFITHHIPFYWLRLSETSAKKLLQNNAMQLVDPDIRRRYNLDLVTNGSHVYNVTKRSKPDKNGKTKILKKELMCTVLSIKTFYNDKGQGMYDKDFLKDMNMRYHICLDEMQPEKGEKRDFDILYAFVNQLENLIRSTKERVKIFIVGNTLEEASDIMCGLNFIPEKFGRYKLVKNKKQLGNYIKELRACKNDTEIAAVNEKYKDIDFGKRAVVEYIEPTEAYKNRRKGTIADILTPRASTFTNEIKVDSTLVDKSRKISPTKIIKFSKDESSWFTIWDGRCVCPYKKEKKPIVAMRPYIDELFSPENQTTIIKLFDTRSLTYKDLITFKRFQKEITLLKPRGN